MTHEEQVALINAFMDNMHEHIQRASVLFPAHWNGHEIREYIAHKFNYERTSLMREARSKRQKRYREYCGEIAVLP